MKNKIPIITGALTVLTLIAGIAFAAQDARSTVNTSAADGQAVTVPDSGLTSARGVTSTTDRISTTGQTSATGSDSSTATTTPVVNGPGTFMLNEGQSTRVVVANAGSVLLARTGGSLSIVSTSSNAAWVVEVEVSTGREVEGDFRNGSLRVTFNFELEDGMVRVGIESEGTAGSTGSTSSTATTNTTATTSSPAPATPTTTTTTTGGSSIPNGSVTYNLDGAGTVTVIFDGGMTIGSINPAAGWIVDKSDQSSNEIEVELVSGEAEVELNLHITGGQLVVQIDRT